MHALLIRNPVAGRKWSRRQLPDAIGQLEAGGWTVEVADTQTQHDARDFAYQAAIDGYDVVVAAGGDGTINEVANGLLKAGEEGDLNTALGILPAGTANVLARDLGLNVPLPGGTKTLRYTASQLLHAQVIDIDVGLATSNDRRQIFTCWAGIGLDAAITAHVMAYPDLKKRLGPLLFGISALYQVRRINNAPLYTVKVDNETWQNQAVLTVASNIQHYAVILDMAPKASLVDGLLDVAFFQATDAFSMLKVLWLLRSGQHIDEPGVRYARAARVEITCETPQPIHLDAEPFGTSPVTLEIIPQALPLLIPTGSASGSLTSPGPNG
ncbi:MAG: diacylglycerol kinase family protein [Chloroflexota bacterium]|nr:diacylglycerol kinase family protein [Chloroflexota bacterium]